MKQLKRIPLTNDFVRFNIPPGMYERIVVSIVGINQGGATLSIADLGSMRLLVNNKQFQNISLDRLSFYGALKGGAVAAVSAIGAAFNFQFDIPMAVPGDLENVLFVENDGEVVLELDGFYGAGIGVILSGDVSVYGVERQGIQSYYLRIDTNDYNAVQGTGNEDIKGVENIYELFIENDSTNLTKVIVFADQKTKYNADRLPLVNKTNSDNQIETFDAAIAYIALPMSESKQLSEALNDSAVIQTEMGAGALLNVFMTSIDFTKTKMVASSNVLAAQVGVDIDRKDAAGKNRAGEVIRG